MLDIVTDRLRLRRLSWGSAVHKQVEWLNDPDVVKYSEQRHKKHTFNSQCLYLSTFLSPPHYFREIRLDGELIGTITAYYDEANNLADMGILIGEKSKWGDGYGTEAWIGMRDFLFSEGIRKVEAGCMALNRGMIGICRKAGMLEEGRRPEHFMLGNNNTCSVVYFGQLNPRGI